jgi:hypothetical protein
MSGPMPAPSSQFRPSAGDDFADRPIDARDIARYRAMLKQQAARDGPAGGMEIATGGKGRSVKRLLAWALLLAITAAAFTLLFVQFTANLRVALVIVLAMLLYMLVTARMAETAGEK